MKRWLGLVGVALVVAVAATGAMSSIARGDDSGGGSGDCSAQSTKSDHWKAEHCKTSDAGKSTDGATTSGDSSATRGEVMPNATGEMDCNGWSPKYESVKQTMMSLCTDPISVKGVGKVSRFVDNGWYVGHDEPSVKFISNAAGSGNHMTYYAQLPVDPTAAPTLDGSVTDYAELTLAPWFGLPICDPKSFPQNPCTPDSDANRGALDNPAADAGSAFMELQFYAPGYQPFLTGPSCDQTHYCAALTIDSLECNLETCNPNCIEPVNFAYLQHDGMPAGPPSPQLADYKTFTPNEDTLMMNQGDSIRVTIADTPDGLRTEVDDLTTGQSGFMVASAANGFMNTSIENCGGTPFSFHAEYNTARQQNQVPWAALEGGVLMETELGHFETCASVSNPLATDSGVPLLPADPHTFQTCNGGMEGSGATGGEGPCSIATFDCRDAKTEGGGACPSDNAASGNLCEFSDAVCDPAGARPVSPDVTFGGVSSVSWPIAGCLANFFQNGDLDFEGTAYRPDWPDGTPNHPTPFRYAGPFDPEGHPYPQVQFETDLGGSEAMCNPANGEHCTAPPEGASFYPFWTIGNQTTPTGFPSTQCLWNFGNDIAGVTTNDFGRAAQYGAPDVSRYGGTLTSSVMPNPQLSSTCGS